MEQVAQQRPIRITTWIHSGKSGAVGQETGTSVPIYIGPGGLTWQMRKGPALCNGFMGRGPWGIGQRQSSVAR